MIKMKDLKDKTLLILSLYYPNKKGDLIFSVFVKAQVEELKKYFKKIIVIAPMQYFPKTLNKCKFFPQKYRDFSKLDNYTYDNVEVYFPRYFTLPTEYFRQKNGDYSYKATKKCIEKNNLQFDLIHAHFTWPSGYVGTKLKKDYGTKLFITGHGFDVYDLPFRNDFWRNKIKNILNNTDKLITVSESNNKCLIKLGFEDEIVLPNGFNSEKFKFIENKNKLKKDLDVELNKKILLHVGNLVKVKNHINLIKSIKELTKIRKDFILYLIGDGPDKQKITNKIKELKLEEYIKVLGQKPHDEIPLWMNVADLFVLPSYSESFGVVNIEDLACGTPVVSTINGGSESILTSEDYGFLLENPNNYKELSSLINKALNKKWDKDKIIEYSKKYHWDKIVKNIIKEYEKVLK